MLCRDGSPLHSTFGSPQAGWGHPCQTHRGQTGEFRSRPQEPGTWDYILPTNPDSVSPIITEGLPNRHRDQVCDGPASLWTPRPLDSSYLTLIWSQASRSGFHEALCSKCKLKLRGTMSLLRVSSSSFDKFRGHTKRLISLSWYQYQGANTQCG